MTTSKPFRSPRAGRRREILAALRAQKDNLTWLINRWDIRTTVFVDRGDREAYGLGPNEWHRPRRAGEYPETNAQEWRQTAAIARMIARKMINLAVYAEDQAAEVSQEKVSRP